MSKAGCALMRRSRRRRILSPYSGRRKRRDSANAAQARSMRILVLNANTTSFVTETAANEAKRVASPGTEIVPATGDFGAAIVGTRAEHAIAEHAAVVLAARHAPGCDAVVIAVSYDTALKPLREMLDIPVVGMTEAALLAAGMVGGPIGLISFGKRVWPVYRELIAAYGLGDR